MKTLKFCPECGKETLKWDGEKKWSCPKCGFNLYNNVAGAVAVIVRCKDEILLTRRNQDPQKGKLDLAGGFVDPRESAEETCLRELHEELAVKVDASKLKYCASLPNVYHYKGIDYNTLDLFYEYRTDEKFEVNLELAEISEAVWIAVKDLNIEEIAFDSQKKFLKEYQQNLR